MTKQETSEQTPERPTPEQLKKAQQELQRHFNKFKKKFKTYAKSELVAIIWEQGMEFKKLQDIAQELYEENKALKGTKNDQENSKDSE